jgi:hypothetical protein
LGGLLDCQNGGYRLTQYAAHEATLVAVEISEKTEEKKQ